MSCRALCTFAPSRESSGIWAVSVAEDPSTALRAVPLPTNSWGGFCGLLHRRRDVEAPGVGFGADARLAFGFGEGAAGAGVKRAVGTVGSGRAGGDFGGDGGAGGKKGGDAGLDFVGGG